MKKVVIASGIDGVPTEGDVTVSAEELRALMGRPTDDTELKALKEEHAKLSTKYDRALEVATSGITLVAKDATKETTAQSVRTLMQASGDFTETEITTYVESLGSEEVSTPGDQSKKEEEEVVSVDNAEVTALKEQIKEINEKLNQQTKMATTTTADTLKRRMESAIAEVTTSKDFGGGLVEKSAKLYADVDGHAEKVQASLQSQVRQQAHNILREKVKSGVDVQSLDIESITREAGKMVGEQYQTVIGEKGFGPTPETVAGSSYQDTLDELSSVKAPTQEEVRKAGPDDLNGLEAQLGDSNLHTLLSAAQELEVTTSGESV